ncbi:MAG: flagellin, partial [Clostridia bacterium]|nr:flagellin [Clostridia bacterium]
MRINNNIAALNTLRQYSSNTVATNKSMEKLSSGSRINRAGDDAAGLAISEKMRAQIRGINMAADNSQNAISLVQTAEGALTETHSILQRMNELAVQSASDTNETIDRNALNAEFQELVKEIDDIANQTKFNNKTLLDGSVGVAIDTATSTLDEVAGVASMTASGESMTYTFADDGTDLIINNGLGDSVTLDSPAAGDTIRVAQWGIEVKLTTGFEAGTLDGTLVTGASSGLTIQTGATNGEKLTIDINSMKAADLGISGSTKIDT